jgi:hypothetical protein
MNQYLKYLTEYSSQSTVGVAKSTIREFLRSAYGLSESEDFDLGAKCYLLNRCLSEFY